MASPQAAKQAEAWHQHAGSLFRAGQLAEAATCFEQALRLRPDYAEACAGLGAVLGEMGRWEEAAASYRSACRLAPADAIIHFKLASALDQGGDIEEALAAHERAIALAPDNAHFHFPYAYALFRAGKVSQGVRELEWSLDHHPIFKRDFAQPRWDGQDFPGRTLLLHASGGLGDALQFVRYAPLVARRGGRLLLECQPQLKILFERIPGPSLVFGRGEPIPAFDVHCPLQFAPWLFAASMLSVNSVPYLTADPVLVAHWGRIVSQVPGCKVGVCWQSGGGPTGRDRSAPLAAFAPLARVAGVQLISLQVGRGQEQQSMPGAPVGLIELGPKRYPFEQTAALIANLDLVVCVDTSNAHLAGALGKPVWKLMRGGPVDRSSDSTWYPTMRRFQQSCPGDWTQVMEHVAAELERFVAKEKETAATDCDIRGPAATDFHFHHAQSLLRAGRLHEGVQELHWSCEHHPAFKRDFAQPRWDGQDFHGRTLLLHASGDVCQTLQHVRYAPLAARRGGRLLLECQPELKTLLQRVAGPSRVLGRGEPLPAFDVHCPLLVVPFIVPTSFLSNDPGRVPYLAADPELVERWARVVGPWVGYKVGICWQGDAIAAEQSAPLTAFAPLAHVAGTQLISLQLGPGLDRQSLPGAPAGLLDFGPERYPFEQAAALITDLDLVVSVESSIAHLAGALGKPVWRIAKGGAVDQDGDSSGYPTMRTFQPATPGDWTQVMDQVTAGVRKLVARRKG